VQVHAAGAQDGALGGEQDGGGGLEEEEGLFGTLVVELFDVVGVVAADAHDLGDKMLALWTIRIQTCSLGRYEIAPYGSSASLLRESTWRRATWKRIVGMSGRLVSQV
jgi:hypothetical protein